jgi:sigma-B regulation protein RsbU (phosphoserine phosphatase)
MSVVNAGHLPVLYLPKDASATFIELNGDVLGGFSKVAYGTQEIKVTTGDRFYLYTDGLVEEPGKRRVWSAGLEKVLATVDQARDVPIQESVHLLFDLTMNGRGEPEDDIVLLGVEV